MKKCKNCGKELPDKANFCSNCGTSLTTSVAKVTPEVQHKTETVVVTVEPAKHTQPRCPMCRSTNLIYINTGARVATYLLFNGLTKWGMSSFKCRDCGYMF